MKSLEAQHEEATNQDSFQILGGRVRQVAHSKVEAALPWASDATTLSPSIAGNCGSAHTVQGQTQR